MTTMQKFKAYFGMVPPSEYEDDYLDEPGPGPVRAQRERSYRDEYYGDTSFRDTSFRDTSYGDDEYADPGYREPAPAYPEERRYAAHGGSEGAAPRRPAAPTGPSYAAPTYNGPSYSGAHDGPGYESGYSGAPEYTYAGGRAGAEVPPERPRPRLEPLQRSGGATLRTARPAGGPDQHGELERVFADGPLHKITTLRPSDYGEARTIGERFRDGNPVIMDLVNMSNADAKRLVDFAAGLAFALRGSFDKVATKVFLLSPADVDVSPEDRRKIAETGFYNQS
ncbi:MAG: cell division protein SepF [Gordonia sp. (in: high G+C Gram-positive bacteria)]